MLQYSNVKASVLATCTCLLFGTFSASHAQPTSATAPASGAMRGVAFEIDKVRVLASIDRRVDVLAMTRSCVGNAETRKELKSCREQEHVALERLGAPDSAASQASRR